MRSTPAGILTWGFGGPRRSGDQPGDELGQGRRAAGNGTAFRLRSTAVHLSNTVPFHATLQAATSVCVYGMKTHHLASEALAALVEMHLQDISNDEQRVFDLEEVDTGTAFLCCASTAVFLSDNALPCGLLRHCLSVLRFHCLPPLRPYLAALLRSSRPTWRSRRCSR